MFASFLRPPTTKTLALEVVGLVTGLQDVKRGQSNILANQHCERLATKIDKALIRETGTVDADTRAFLTEAKTHLAQLGKQQSSQATGHFHASRFGAIPIYRAKPEWQRAYNKFRADMIKPAERFVASRAPGSSRGGPSGDPEPVKRAAPGS
jgi:hypothetical protein